jgi:hypothetical protein
MMPMTPSGTRIWPTWMPLGRNFMFEISPIGSGSATIWRRPSTMVAMALSDSARRSSRAGARPAARAASRSRAFAATQCRRVALDGVGDQEQRAVAGGAVGARHRARGRARLAADLLHVIR